VIADEAVFPEPAPTGIEALSPTERRMVFMIAKSMTSAEFAKKLRISIRTVETHRLNASRKLGFSGANSLLRFALAHSYELEALID
jgi:DNA-binding CsgD family transcriptional regulator